MTLRRRALVAAAAVLGTSLAALIVLPALFQDRLAERVRAGIDGVVDARVEWGDVGVTFLRDFPNLTFALEDLTVVGVDPFQGDSLASMEDFRLVLDVGSVVRGLWRGDPVVVRSVHLDAPRLHLRVLEDGTANWDVLRERPPDADTEQPRGTGRELRVALRELAVEDGTVVLDDRRAGVYASLLGVSHTLRGDFTRDSLLVRTRTRSEAATVRFAGVPWLSGVALDLEADLAADLAEKRFAFRENRLRLEELAVSFSGDAARVGEDLALDLTFAAPEADFRQILSLVPPIGERDFSSLEASGSVAVDGRVQGVLGGETVPSFTLTATVADGTFHYPDLPLPARNISVALSVENPAGDMDSTVVALDPFHVEIGERPLDGALAVRTPVSDPAVDLRVEGILDLADLARTVKLPEVDELRGVVAADATVRARMSDLDRGRWERVTARGELSARGLAVAAPDLPAPMTVEEAALSLSPRRAELTSLDARIGASDLRATGQVDNLLGFALRDEALRATAIVDSRRFVLDDWRSDDPEREVIAVPAGLDLVLEARVEELAYGDLVLSGARGTVRVADRRVTLENVRGTTLGGGIAVDGFYETTDSARPTFGVDLGLDSIDIPRASEALLTVRTLAPVARFARGTFSTDLTLDGALGADMTPLLDVLGGQGSLLTSTLVLQDFPLMERLAEALEIPQLDDPTLRAIRSSFEIRDGRMHVRPFQVEAEGLTMSVRGSNGIDQSLDYTLALAVPRGLLGADAERVVRGLAARAAGAGVDLEAADVVEIGARITGTVGDPSLSLDFGGVLESARELAGRAAAEEVERRVEAAETEAAAAREEARRRARARADSIVAEAEAAAATIRREARTLAEQVRAEGERRAEELLAAATNPVARAAARVAADRIRSEAGDRADGIVAEADRRADDLVADARRRAAAVLEGVGLAPPPVDTTGADDDSGAPDTTRGTDTTGAADSAGGGRTPDPDPDPDRRPR